MFSSQGDEVIKVIREGSFAETPEGQRPVGTAITAPEDRKSLGDCNHFFPSSVVVFHHVWASSLPPLRGFILEFESACG